MYIYIHIYTYVHIVYQFTLYPNKTVLRGFLRSLCQNLQAFLEFSLASFWVSCNVPHSFSLCTAGRFRFRCRALKDILLSSFSPSMSLPLACNNSNCEISMPLAGHKVRQSHKSCHVVATR